MIAAIEGRVGERTEHSCILHTEGGLGYEVYLPVHALADLPEKGGFATFYTCQIVREDSQELFGFPTWDERQVFLLLISITRVGARTALAVLSQFRPDDLRRVVLEDDVLALTRVSGIGKKSAQQIFLELKYKLKVDNVPVSGLINRPGALFRDVLTGLTNLGYAEDEVAPRLREVLAEQPDLDVSSALRATLKALGKSK